MNAPISARTQRERILNLLISSKGQWIPVIEIAALAKQYNARLLELRRMGFQIKNRIREENGERLSWFMLETGAEEPKQPSTRLFNTPVRHSEGGHR